MEQHSFDTLRAYIHRLVPLSQLLYCIGQIQYVDFQPLWQFVIRPVTLYIMPQTNYLGSPCKLSRQQHERCRRATVAPGATTSVQANEPFSSGGSSCASQPQL